MSNRRIRTRGRIPGAAALLVVLGLVTLIASWVQARGGAAAQPGVDSAVLQVLSWRPVGPYKGGKAEAVAGDPASAAVFYHGSSGGGVWKTDDAGITWRNVSDGQIRTSSVGAIAVSPSNPTTVYVGMGESCMRITTSRGDGVYRSDDAGKTWRHLGLDATQHISKIRIHPQNPEIVYVAAFGDAYGPNPDRGVFRSKDGGKTWQKVLYKADNVGAIDLTMVPSNPQVLYAALWEFRNYPWTNRVGGAGSGIFKTTDGGDTWTELTNNPGLPKGPKGRIGIDVSPAKPDRVWALMTAEGEGAGVWPPKGTDVPAGWKPCRDYICAGNGLYRSDDGGATWQLVSNDPNFFERPWYYTHVIADTKDSDTFYVLGVNFWKSTDAGRTFTTIRLPHGDSHGLWIDPANPRRMINANDGGATISLNGGVTWSTVNNQPTGKFYRVGLDNQFPYRIYAGQQDNSSVSVPSRSDSGFREPEWYQVGGGENAVVAVDPRNPDISYGGDHHWVSRYDRRSGMRRWVSPSPENWYGWAPKQLKYRYFWPFPVVISRHDPRVLYVGAQVIFRSTDEGESWSVISPDLTLHDAKTMEDTLPSDPGEYAGPTTRENLTQWYSTLTNIVESPVQAGVIWTGSDDGLVYLTRDNGKVWNNVTPGQIEPHTHIATVEASPHDAATAYVAATRYQLGDSRPYLYKTADYGQTWTKITTGIPETDFTRTIRQDPVQRGLLYAGTEFGGVYVSFNDGASWQSIRLDLPVVPVWDLAVADNDLVAATHGRSFWVLDDLTVLRQLQADPEKRGTRLFQPETTVRFRGAAGRGPADEGQNPPNGAVIRYYFSDTPPGEVRLSILDAAGGVVRTFSSVAPPATTDPGAPQEGPSPRVPARAGANVFVWDLRYPNTKRIPGVVLRRGDPGGPIAVPGRYEVRLEANGESIVKPFDVVKDPRYATTPQDFADQFALVTQIRDKEADVYRAVAEIRNIRQQVDAATRGLRPQQVKKVAPPADAIKSKLWSIEDALIQFRVEAPHPAPQALIAWPVKLNDKLSALIGFLQTADARPTRQDVEVFKDLSAQVAQQLTRLDDLMRTDLAAFNRLARQQKITEVTLKYLSAPASATGSR